MRTHEVVLRGVCRIVALVLLSLVLSFSTTNNDPIENPDFVDLVYAADDATDDTRVEKLIEQAMSCFARLPAERSVAARYRFLIDVLSNNIGITDERVALVLRDYRFLVDHKDPTCSSDDLDYVGSIIESWGGRTRRIEFLREEARLDSSSHSMAAKYYLAQTLARFEEGRGEARAIFKELLLVLDKDSMLAQDATLELYRLNHLMHGQQAPLAWEAGRYTLLGFVSSECQLTPDFLARLRLIPTRPHLKISLVVAASSDLKNQDIENVSVISQFAIRSFPDYYLIDPEGRVIASAYLEGGWRSVLSVVDKLVPPP